VTNTTNTKEPIGKSANQKATPSLAELDLRDYFAAKAMQAVPFSMNQIVDSQDCRRIALHAYLMADAMLEARK
jgi:hypothetical protein